MAYLDMPRAVVAEADRPTRTITGLVAPYGPAGATSAGPLRIRPGSLHLADDLRRIKLTRGHDREQVIGYATSATDTTDGLVMSFYVAATPEGDAALLEAAEGIRDGLSIDLSASRTDGDELTGGDLVAVGLLPIPAFADARVTSIAAQHTDDDTDDTDDDAAAAAVDPDPDPDPDPATEDETEDDDMSDTATDTTAVTAAAAAPSTRAARPSDPVTTTESGGRVVASVQDFARLVADAQRNPSDPRVQAALADITRSAHEWTSEAGWLGELWSQSGYQRQLVDLCRTDRLDSYTSTGWRWVTPPKGGDYDGDKADIPTNTPETEAVPLEAVRWAGGHDIDRKYFDFNDTEFLESYTRLMVDDYRLWCDSGVMDAWLADGTAYTKPTVSEAIIKGIFAVAMSNQTPSFILVAENILEEAALIPADDFPPLVAAILGDLTADKLLNLSSRFLPNDTVLVGSRNATRFRELQNPPIRVDAVELARGGYDRAFFGYAETFVEIPDALAVVTVGTAPAAKTAAAKKSA